MSSKRSELRELSLFLFMDSINDPLICASIVSRYRPHGMESKCKASLWLLLNSPRALCTREKQAYGSSASRRHAPTSRQIKRARADRNSSGYFSEWPINGSGLRESMHEGLKIANCARDAEPTMLGIPTRREFSRHCPRSLRNLCVA